MNKTAIKNFAIWARKKLIGDITTRALFLGVTESEIKEQLPQSTADAQFFDVGSSTPSMITGNDIQRRDNLLIAIQQKDGKSDHAKAFNNLIEEVAYTWFNRLIAVRFMEVNDYLPGRMRVLSSTSETKLEPDFVTSSFESGFEFTSSERERIVGLKHDNKLDELFQMLFIRQCNDLNKILPELFERTDDYTELLLNISFADREGVVYRLTHDIPEEDFNVTQGGQVEIIGWLYQFYNTEPKDEVFALLKKNVKITKERIPAATQLFTPDWIVRYMVENSLGRLWLDGHPDAKLQEKWRYFLPEAGQEADVAAQLAVLREKDAALTPEGIKVIDPCMGSGHILVYAFDVMMEIYKARGYAERDAAALIITDNLYGLDLDKRAYQLSYFALMMKARQYDRRFFGRDIAPNLGYLQDLTVDTSLLPEPLQALTWQFANADVYGSLLNPEIPDSATLNRMIDKLDDGLFNYSVKPVLQRMMQIGSILSQRYDAVITNPPYMGSGGMSAKLADFVKENYPDSKGDLFAVFIERCSFLTKTHRYYAMITQQAWMFLSSYEKLREKTFAQTITNMAHLGARAFEEIGGEVVQTTAFIIAKSQISDHLGTYSRLIDFNSQEAKEEAFLAKDNIFLAKQEDFEKIPGSPLAYWICDRELDVYADNQLLDQYCYPRKGLDTGENDKFLRLWHEVNIKKTCLDNSDHSQKWFPYNKGGSFRRWYGNREYLINWLNDGFGIKQRLTWSSKKPTIRNANFYFREGFAWTTISSGGFSARYSPVGALFDNGGCTLFADTALMTIGGFVNSRVMSRYLEFLSPTLNFQPGDISRAPFPKNILNTDIHTDECVVISKSDWDSYETSWDFQRSPMLQSDSVITINGQEQPCRLAMIYESWRLDAELYTENLRRLEVENNRIFIELYGLQDELSPEVPWNEITLTCNPWYRYGKTPDDCQPQGNHFKIVNAGDEIVISNVEPQNDEQFPFFKKLEERLLQDTIKELISYAVGCLMGRYSPDKPGLILADQGSSIEDYRRKILEGGATPDKIRLFADEDGILPVTDEEYFPDDIVGGICNFVKAIFGEDVLESNLNFIAKALGNRGNTPREIIRNYFLNDFYSDHCRTYQKRPIYWLFDSGKANGFKALVYLHRYTSDTIGTLRVDYLHRMQKIYEQEIIRMQEVIANPHDAREAGVAAKRKDKLTKQLQEARSYDEKIAHLALARIELDLDDGVNVNYEKLQTAPDGKKYPVLAKI